MSAKLRKILSLVLTASLLFQQVGFAQIATELNIASHLSRMASNFTVDRFCPLHLRYFSYNNLNDNFKVLLDKGDLKNLKDKELKSSTKTLLNYFLVGVTLPDSMFWVNLRPDSEDQIIDQYLEKTDIGKIMLEADLQLKKDTALFTSPQTPEGKVYWDKLYKKAADLYGYDNVSIPTLTRPWIVPGEIIVRESQDSAYVYKANLKVMLEQDYLKDSSAYNFKDERSKALNEYSSELIRELIIPKLTREVNSSKRYAPLRQVYYSLILARWFKLRFSGKTGNYTSLINTRDLTNLISLEPWSKTTYFKQYQKSFTEGEYSLKAQVYTPTGQAIRSYFSGGLDLASSAINFQNGFTSKGVISPKLLTLGVLMGGKSVDGIQEISAASPIITEKKERINLLDGTTRRRVLKVYEEKNRDVMKTALATGLPLNIVDEYVRGAKRRTASSAINTVMDERLNIISQLSKKTPSKIVYLVMDGLGGVPLDGQTELDKANHPNLDKLSTEASVGIMRVTDIPGITPGSGPGHFAIFGYNPYKSIGRGVLDALGESIELEQGDIVARGNFATLSNEGIITDRRAGRLKTDESRKIIQQLFSGIEIEGVKFLFYPTKEYRLALVIRGKNLSTFITDSDPGKDGQAPYEIKAQKQTEEAKRLARLMNQLTDELNRRLRDNKIAPNANTVLFRAFDSLQDFPVLNSVYKVTPAAICTYPAYKGIAKILGMDVLPISGEALQDQLNTLRENFEKYDFFYFHVKQTDSYGEDGNFAAKMKKIEEVDAIIPEIIKMMNLGNGDTLIITGDHSTPARLKSHSWHPVPVIIYSKNSVPSKDVTRFTESQAKGGSLGQVIGRDIMPLAFAEADKFEKLDGPIVTSASSAVQAAANNKFKFESSKSKQDGLIRTFKVGYYKGNDRVFFPDEIFSLAKGIFEKIRQEHWRDIESGEIYDRGSDLYIELKSKSENLNYKVFSEIINTCNEKLKEGASLAVEAGVIELAQYLKELLDDLGIPETKVNYDHLVYNFAMQGKRLKLDGGWQEAINNNSALEVTVSQNPGTKDILAKRKTPVASSAVTVNYDFITERSNWLKEFTEKFNDARKANPLLPDQFKDLLLRFIRGLPSIYSIDEIKQVLAILAKVAPEAFDSGLLENALKEAAGERTTDPVEAQLQQRKLKNAAQSFFNTFPKGNRLLTIKNLKDFGEVLENTLASSAVEADRAAALELEKIDNRIKELMHMISSWEELIKKLKGKIDANNDDRSHYTSQELNQLNAERWEEINRIQEHISLLEVEMGQLDEKAAQLKNKDNLLTASSAVHHEVINLGTLDSIKVRKIDSEALKNRFIEKIEELIADVREGKKREFAGDPVQLATARKDHYTIYFTDKTWVDIRPQGTEIYIDFVCKDGMALSIVGAVRRLIEISQKELLGGSAGSEMRDVHQELTNKVVDMFRANSLSPEVRDVVLKGELQQLLDDQGLNKVLRQVAPGAGRGDKYYFMALIIDFVYAQEIRKTVAGKDEEKLARLNTALDNAKDALWTWYTAGKASSAVQTKAPDKMGAIDFRSINIAIQPMGSFAGLNFKLPQLTQAQLKQINIELEMRQVKNLIESGTVPSGDRLKELIAACSQKGEIGYYADNLLLCLVDICKLEEQNAFETSPELREALAIVDSVSGRA